MAATFWSAALLHRFFIFLLARRAVAYKTIVSPRAGPTLTMDSFPPVNSEMYLTYFLAAAGSCENFRAA